MGRNKSEKLEVLYHHVSIQIVVIGIILMAVTSFEKALIFAFLNGMIHGFIDWNIWKVYKIYALKKVIESTKQAILDRQIEFIGKSKEQIYMEKLAIAQQEKENFKFYEDHWFYVTIGADQLLHVITIIVLWHWVLIGGLYG